jgi:hypothetical protein
MSLSATVAEAATILPVTPVAQSQKSVVIGGLHVHGTVKLVQFLK